MAICYHDDKSLKFAALSVTAPAVPGCFLVVLLLSEYRKMNSTNIILTYISTGICLHKNLRNPFQLLYYLQE